MLALTVYQPWASLIIEGLKPYEFRRWAAPARIVGQRIVIHAGARKVRRAEIDDLLARLADDPKGTGLTPAATAIELLRRWVSADHRLGPSPFPLAVGLGTAVLGQPRRASALFRGVIDSDRIDQHVWAWPLGEIERWPVPIPARGFQGFWTWPEKVKAA